MGSLLPVRRPASLHLPQDGTSCSAIHHRIFHIRSCPPGAVLQGRNPYVASVNGSRAGKVKVAAEYERQQGNGRMRATQRLDERWSEQHPWTISTMLCTQLQALCDHNL
jgi:hypothetical protein